MNNHKGKKLLRPLHRQRTRRKRRAEVMNSADLQALFNLSAADLPGFLEQNNISYHRDSTGEIWVSQDLKDWPAPPPPYKP